MDMRRCFPIGIGARIRTGIGAAVTRGVIGAGLLAPVPALAVDECLDRPAAQIHTMPGGVVTSRELVTTPTGVGGTYIWPAGSLRYYGMGVPFPASGPMPNPQPDPRNPGGYQSNPNDNKYPVYFNTAGGTICLIGLKVQGQQHRELFWNVLKSFYDGDGSHAQGSGHVVIRNLWTDNVEDGFAPRGPVNGGGALTTMDWEVHDSYARYNRDDWLENDAMFNGLIDNVLIDGTFVFFSARPNTGGRNYTINISNALVHMQDLPYNGDMGMHPGYFTDGNVAHAQLFKMATAGTPTLTVTDSIFYIDPHTDPVPNAWAWPKGTYTNVTLVWTGTKPFWSAPPAGVTITNDVSVWTNARANWLIAHGCDLNGDNCTWKTGTTPTPPPPDPPPPAPTSLTLDPATGIVTIHGTPPTDMAGWVVGTSPVPGTTWTQATPLGGLRPPVPATVLPAEVPPGTRRVLAKMQDRAGQQSPTAAGVDLPLPADDPPPAPTNLAYDGSVVIWTAAALPDFGSFRLRDGATPGAPWTLLAPWGDTTLNEVATVDLPAGTRRVGVAIVDLAGQEGPPLLIDLPGGSPCSGPPPGPVGCNRPPKGWMHLHLHGQGSPQEAKPTIH
jgi:hypothetical protein